MLGQALDTLFPRRCGGCSAGGSPFCSDCWREVGLLGPPGCRRCGRPLDGNVDTCADCPPRPVAWSRSAFLYEGPVRRALFRLKFSGWGSLAGSMAPWLLGALLQHLPVIRPPPDARTAVTWVPLGRARRRGRGYDQARLLAAALARLTGWRLASLLGRTTETPPQAPLSGPERRTAMTGAFGSRARPPSYVVLVDDVLTTGATVAECARVLTGSGAREVGVLTVARSLGGPVPARCYTRSGSGLGLWLPGGCPPGSRCQSQAKRPT